MDDFRAMRYALNATTSEGGAMFRFFARWRQKRKLKKAFRAELIETIVLDFFDDLDGPRDEVERKLESRYLELGLTPRDLEKARNSIGPWIRVE